MARWANRPGRRALQRGSRGGYLVRSGAYRSYFTVKGAGVQFSPSLVPPSGASLTHS